jgi:hypothetical protein
MGRSSVKERGRGGWVRVGRQHVGEVGGGISEGGAKEWWLFLLICLAALVCTLLIWTGSAQPAEPVHFIDVLSTAPQNT